MIPANGSMTRSFLWCHHAAVGTHQCTEAVQMIWAPARLSVTVYLRQKAKGSIITVIVKRDEEIKEIKVYHQASRQVLILQPSYYK